MLILGFGVKTDIHIYKIHTMLPFSNNQHTLYAAHVILLCLAEQPLNQYSLRAPFQWQQLQGEAVSCRQTCPWLSPLVQRPCGGELIINLSNSCLILFIVNRFRTVILPSPLLRETHNTHDQAHYYRGQSVSIPQQGDREMNLWFCPVFSHPCYCHILAKKTEHTLWTPHNVGHAYFKCTIWIDGIATCSPGC